MLIDGQGKEVASEAKIISWEAWQQQRDDFVAQNERVVLSFPHDEDISKLSHDVEHFKEICLTFPTFKDGRAYSQARILRTQLGFKGTLRACGDVLQDQVFFMRRCGFDRFQPNKDIDLRAWQKALEGFSVIYQPSSEQAKTIWELRSQK